MSGLVILMIYAVSYAQEWQYEVKQGDSLWTITDHYLIHESYVRRLQKYNNLSNPLILQPGQIIKAPVEWLGNLPSSAKVLYVIGTAEVVNNNQKNIITSGYELKANDQLITGDDGSLKIEFSDKSLLNVYSNTSMLFRTMKQSHDGSVLNVKIDIEKGRVNVFVNPNKDPGHRLEIESPSAVTAVRGTNFRIGVDPRSKDTVTEVLKGKVEVLAEQRSIAVKQLYGTKTEEGKRPINPVRLLEGPIIKPQEIILTKVAALQWAQLEGAENYRIRVSGKEDFSDIFYEKFVSTTQVDDIFFANDGDFFVSVRAADKNHIEGLDAVAKLKVNARPEPPLIISPQKNATTFNSLPRFAWTTPADGIERLRFQLSTKPDFTKIIYDQTFVSKDGFEMQDPLEAREYYWRVANIDADGQGPYSLPFMFAIKSQPEVASKIIESDAGSQVSLTLSSDPSISKHHVQVARDEQFTKLIFDDWIEGDEFAFNTEGAGSYYIRLGVEELESGTINYADAQKIQVPFNEWGKVLMSLFTGLLIAL